MRGHQLITSVLVLAAFASSAAGGDSRGIKPVFNMAQHPIAEGFFDSPLPLQVRSVVSFLPGGARSKFGSCQRALQRAAGSGADHDRLADIYDGFIRERLKQSRVVMDEEAPTQLFFRMTIIEIPDSLWGEHAKTKFCLVELETELSGKGEQTLPWKPESRFISTVSLYVSKNKSFMLPEKLHDFLSDNIEEQINLMAPTLRGDIKESCGYFIKDPEWACIESYDHDLSIYRERLKCTSDEIEAAELKEKIAKIEEKLAEVPPEVMAKKPPIYFSVDGTISDKPIVDECEKYRDFSEGAGGNEG